MNDKKSFTDWIEMWRTSIHDVYAHKVDKTPREPNLIVWKDIVFSYEDLVYCRFKKDNTSRQEEDAVLMQFRGERFEIRIEASNSEFLDLVKLLHDMQTGLKGKDEATSE